MPTLDVFRTIRSELALTLTRVDKLIEEAARGDARGSVEVLTLPRTRAVEYVLAQASEPMRPVQIWAELQRIGRDDPKNEVQVTTFDLWERGRIGKVARGLYKLEPDGRGTR